jgi:hypothetical protein
MKFVIQGEIDPDHNEQTYWNNEMGWADLTNATHFCKNEIFKINMPLGHTGVAIVNNGFIEEEMSVESAYAIFMPNNS